MAVIARLRGGEWFNFLSTHHPEMAEAVQIYYTYYHLSQVQIINDYNVLYCLLLYFHRSLNGYRGVLTPEHRKMFEIADNNSDNVRSELRRVFP